MSMKKREGGREGERVEGDGWVCLCVCVRVCLCVGGWGVGRPRAICHHGNTFKSQENARSPTLQKEIKHHTYTHTHTHTHYLSLSLSVYVCVCVCVHRI